MNIIANIRKIYSFVSHTFAATFVFKNGAESQKKYFWTPVGYSAFGLYSYKSCGGKMSLIVTVFFKKTNKSCIDWTLSQIKLIFSLLVLFLYRPNAHKICLIFLKQLEIYSVVPRFLRDLVTAPGGLLQNITRSNPFQKFGKPTPYLCLRLRVSHSPYNSARKKHSVQTMRKKSYPYYIAKMKRISTLQQGC